MVEIDIEIFKTLSEIVHKHGIKDTAWAKASWPDTNSNPQSRIGELRRIVRLMDEDGMTQREASDIVKRLWTIDKLDALRRGLIDLIGRRKVDPVLNRAFKEEKDPRKKLHYAVMRVPEDRLEDAVRFLEVLQPPVEEEPE